MVNRTKIVCTMGPAVNSLPMICRLIEAGMDSARLNCSHGSHEEHQQTIYMLKAAREQMQRPLSIMLDIKGPEVRVGVLPASIQIKALDEYELVSQEQYQQDADHKLPITPICVLSDLKDGMQVLLDDGNFLALVRSHAQRVWLVFQNEGLLKSRKSINIPQAKLNLPAFTEKDKADLLFAIDHQLEWVAASFIRSADHILQIKSFLNDHGGSSILLCAKIENQEGVDHFDEIVKVADGIMIARGDLGVEVPLSQVPRLQKMMLKKAALAGKPTVTATQMLESMIHNPRPTRAEVSDVANAIYDSSAAVMLSGETAVGKYPIETVQMMYQTIQETESDFDYKRFSDQQNDWHFNDVSSAIALAAVKTAFSSQAKAIFCSTHSGHTARLISRHRPKMPIIACTTDQQVYHQLALEWGVNPVLLAQNLDLKESFLQVSEFAINQKWVTQADLVLMTLGHPFGMSGTTSVMMLEHIKGT